jgi:hypothetical protein
MQSKIQIHDVELFVDILTTISNFSEACKLELCKDKPFSVYLKNSISRIHLESNVCTTDSLEPISISFDKLNKLICPLTAIMDSSKQQKLPIELTFDGNKLSYSGTLISFLLLGVKDEIISSSIDRPIQIELQTLCNFCVEQNVISRILSNSSTIVDSENIQYKLSIDEIKQKMVYIEATSAATKLTNSFKQHLGNVISGTFSDKLNLDEKRLILIKQLNSTVNISVTSKNVLIIQSEKKLDDLYSKFEVYTSILKEQ